MKSQIDYILSNLVFITRIPVKLKFNYKSDGGNVKYFPFVGIIIGLIFIALVSIIGNIFSSYAISAIIVSLGVVITGGIHLDGLSDTADGILSYKDREKTIEIMKDSHIGAMGVIVLFLVLVLKIFVLSDAISKGISFLVFLYPIYGRIGIVDACFLGKPIDKSKLGVGFIGNIRKKEFLLVSSIYFLITGVLFYNIEFHILLNFVVFIGIFLLNRYFVKNITLKIGGISGDILGASCEITELFSIFIYILGYELCKLI